MKGAPESIKRGKGHHQRRLRLPTSAIINDMKLAKISQERTSLEAVDVELSTYQREGLGENFISLSILDPVKRGESDGTVSLHEENFGESDDMLNSSGITDVNSFAPSRHALARRNRFLLKRRVGRQCVRCGYFAREESVAKKRQFEFSCTTSQKVC